MAKLVVISQGLKGASYEMGTHWVTIGRAPGNAFQIVEPSVSGHHCEVQMRGGELIVRDMRSTNGTFVKGALIAEAVVALGERFLIGHVELRLEASAWHQDLAIQKVLNQPADKRVNVEASLQKKTRVLMVDDSMAFLEAAAEMFENLANGSWEIHKASAADQVFAILHQYYIDMAILDIGMPMLDGMQLLAIIHRRHPDVKKVVLTGCATAEHRATCLANGAELFLEKPVTHDGFRSVFNVVNDLISWRQHEGFSGTLRHVGLMDVIQIECLGRKSCILEVRNEQTHGEIFIESGMIVHATTGAVFGEKAFQRLLSLNDGQFHLRQFEQPAERTLQGAWECLLMEAARLRDEERTALSIAETMFLDRAALAEKKSATPDAEPAIGEELVVVSTYDGQWHPVTGDK